MLGTIMYIPQLLDGILPLECQPACEATGTASLSPCTRCVISTWVALGLLALEELRRAEFLPRATQMQPPLEFGEPAACAKAACHDFSGGRDLPRQSRGDQRRQ